MEYDPYFEWDGDGPDPITYWMEPFTAKVSAFKVYKGELLEGKSYLRGCYRKISDDTTDLEVDGYFPQMLQEALRDLNKEVRNYEQSCQLTKT